MWLRAAAIPRRLQTYAAASKRSGRHVGLVSFASTQNVELRVEVFNLLNNFNWNPNLNFSAGTFGRITTSAGDPRVMQFGIKYAF